MNEMAGLDNPNGSPFMVGEKQRAWLKRDRERWQKEFMVVVQKGLELWVSPELGTNQVACAQCHPNGANTHPETYPKFQQQLGRVIGLRDMINWRAHSGRSQISGRKSQMSDNDMGPSQLIPRVLRSLDANSITG